MVYTIKNVYPTDQMIDQYIRSIIQSSGEIGRGIFVIDITRGKYLTIKQRARISSAFAENESLLRSRVIAFVFVVTPVTGMILKAIQAFSKKVVPEIVVPSLEDAIEYAMDRLENDLVSPKFMSDLPR